MSVPQTGRRSVRVAEVAHPANFRVNASTAGETLDIFGCLQLNSITFQENVELRCPNGDAEARERCRRCVLHLLA